MHVSVDVVVQFCPWSVYHLYGKPGNSGENSNGAVHPGWDFQEKSNTLRGITFFPFLPKQPKFSVPFVWFTNVRLHVERKRKIHRYKSIPFLLSVIYGNFFTEISVQMVSALGLNFFLLFEIHYHALPYPKTKENKIWTKDKIEPQHRQSKFSREKIRLCCCFFSPGGRPCE